MQRVRGISSSRVTVAIGTYQLDRRNQKIQKTRSTLPRAIVGVSRSLRTAGVADVAACVSQLLLLWLLLLLFFCSSSSNNRVAVEERARPEEEEAALYRRRNKSATAVQKTGN
ncbi:hypothetical protein ACLKA6_008661 [Drosophila palustris]